MSKYLYGAAVQGIQDFIFQTDELKNIVGASELVEDICTNVFEEFVKDGESVVRAAGNIKYIYNNNKDCENTVKYFPKKVMQKIPGITISQAVVKMDDNSSFDKASMELERRLQIQRNLPTISLTSGLIGIKRSNKTGLPAVKVEKNDNRKEYIDETTEKKQIINNKYKKEGMYVELPPLMKKMFGDIKPEKITDEIDQIASDENKNWVAVIHIDGNSVGNKVKKYCTQISDAKNFSNKLCEATRLSANEASKILQKNDIIPCRPIILGGDDLTIIINSKFALLFTKIFLNEFEKTTKGIIPVLPDQNITACAGIAYIKSKYPFYYGYSLAEELCKYAKNKSKQLNEDNPPSSIMFHKVQDSFIDSFDDIINRELSPNKSSSWVFGPYYLQPQNNMWTIDSLLKQMEAMQKPKDEKRNNGLKNNLRQWLMLMCREDPNEAGQLRERFISLLEPKTSKQIKELTQGMARDGKMVYPVYDILSLISVGTNTK